MSEPRDSYTDVVRMTQSNLSDTSFGLAVSKIKGETVDLVQKTHRQVFRFRDCHFPFSTVPVPQDVQLVKAEIAKLGERGTTLKSECFLKCYRSIVVEIVA